MEAQSNAMMIMYQLLLGIIFLIAVMLVVSGSTPRPVVWDVEYVLYFGHVTLRQSKKGDS